MLPDSMMNCHCGHLDHLSCLGKPHLITVREARDGQRSLYRQGTYQLPFSHKHTLVCVNLVLWQTWDKNRQECLSEHSIWGKKTLFELNILESMWKASHYWGSSSCSVTRILWLLNSNSSNFPFKTLRLHKMNDHTESLSVYTHTQILNPWVIHRPTVL